MADFKTHITTSTVLGAGYAAYGAYRGLPIEAALVAGGLCGIGGMLPDIDSDSGIPVRETMSFAAAIVPMMLVDRFEHLGFNYEQMVLAAGVCYVFVRFGVARLLKRYTVHRGMFHSIPALLIFTGMAFLLCGSSNLQLRYFKAVGVFLGVLSHLLLDEIYAVEWSRGRWRFKKSFGTALKLWSKSSWSNVSAYAKLALVIALILGEPMIMDRYGQLSPVVINQDVVRERFHLPARGGEDIFLAEEAERTQPTSDEYRFLAPTSAPPESSKASRPDRDVYDTARRILTRIWD